MQFQVPQFIDVEDQVVGPLTWRQFLYLAAGGGVLLILWFLLTPLVWFVAAAFVGGLAIAAAFVKVNGRSFFPFLASVLGFAVKPRQYVWRNPQPTQETPAKQAEQTPPSKPKAKEHLTASKIRELAWSLTAKKDQPR
ncbi:PrgI family protein [Candidatus Parcubacteria bacterium]|nr:PrgI family protein [Candidatus Parcubacteria bacterium]